MDGLDDMTVFKATVDHGSASAAGRHLGMPKSTVARRILELETRLGTPLFHRGRQHYVLTSFGKDCYQQCARVVIEAEKVFAMADRQRGTPTGSLHVICPPLIGEMLIDQLAAEFVIAEPHVRLHLDAGMTVFDPRPASADLIIYPTFEPLPNSDVIARRIFTNEYVLAASPQFLDGRSLRDPQALKSFECLGLGSPASEWVWRLKRGREAALHRFTPRFTTTQLSALRQAVRSIFAAAGWSGC